MASLPVDCLRETRDPHIEKQNFVKTHGSRRHNKASVMEAGECYEACTPTGCSMLKPVY